jgi:hypothetical protein
VYRRIKKKAKNLKERTNKKPVINKRKGTKIKEIRGLAFEASKVKEVTDCYQWCDVRSWWS